MNLALVEWHDVFLAGVRLVDVCVLGMLAIYALVYLFQLGAAFVELRRNQQQGQAVTPWWLLTSKVALPISILVPAYNEEKTIVESLRSLLALHYPEFEVIVANDGSKDGTLALLIRAFEMKRVTRAFPLAVKCMPIRGVYQSTRHPRLTLIDKENGGRSDALNAALNLARNPLVCVVDADSMLEPDALLRLARPFILDPESMVAVGGKIRVVNGCEVRSGQVVKVALPRRWLPLFQVVEYIRSFQIARLSWSRIQSVIIISGAFGLFRRTAVMRVGGYDRTTVGEDMELTVKLHRYYRDQNMRYRVSYLSDPVCWTEVPSTLKILGAQRSRWARGMLEVLWRHRAMVFAPRYGLPGVFGLGYFFVFDAIGPLVELVGYIVVPACWLLGVLNTPFFLAYLGLLFVFGVFVSVGSLYLEETSSRDETPPRDLAMLTLAAFVENFGYRQLNGFWRIRGWWQFLRKQKGWGAMTRTGFSATTPPGQPRPGAGSSPGPETAGNTPARPA